MQFDYTKYNPPGVYTEAIPGPQLSVTSDSPNAVAIVGESVGHRFYTETIVIPDDVSSLAVYVPLTKAGASASSIVVRNSQTNSTYSLTTDYVVQTLAGAGSTLGDGDDVVSIKRVLNGGLSAATPVQVSYQYTDSDYFTVKTFFDFDDLRDQYGPSFDIAGAISSPLTLAASLAIQNGAQRIVCVSTTGGTNQNYIDALTKLENEPSVSAVAVTSGNSAVISAVNVHVTNQSSNKHERRAILGVDGTSTAISSSAKIDIAKSIVNARVALVSPSVVKYYNGEANQYIYLGAQYLAAAIAGLSVSINSSTPLTKKSVLGFAGLKELISEQQKSAETQGGLLVVEQSTVSTSNLRIRHGVTTDSTNIFTKEWSITGQQDSISFQIRSYLDNSGLIGSIIDSDTAIAIKATADAALNNLVSSATIITYQNLKVRQQISSPDVIEVRFDWQPALPLNYIVARFSINVSTGDTASALNTTV